MIMMNDRLEDKGWLIEDEMRGEEPDYSNIENVCIKCGSSNLEFTLTEPHQEYIEFFYKCDECETEGVLIYGMSFYENKKT